MQAGSVKYKYIYNLTVKTLFGKVVAARNETLRRVNVLL